ncbi:ABC transporter permease [Mesorhizobium sp. B3-1-3]|uniref:ABC transporter permease n=1 Tax=unclassified Mesorhizobium TaxID=325217 RepID=UPI00112BEEAE|nr:MULTISPECIES: ABC transporter permease [unclassified Mesorhizobium]TPI57352.1 ABC transporter permease [Mesorhizobium sp. B3-1-8]TPI63505.1 ABC transporter permease [Mesorhizobium sp. B3-1-3]
MKRSRHWSPDFALKFLLIPPALFLLPTFFLPLVVVVYRAFGAGRPSLDNFKEIAFNHVYLTVLWQTFQTAIYATALCVVIAFPIAQLIARANRFWSGIAFALVMIPFWTSVVTRTYAWIAILSRRGLINNLLIQLDWIEQPLRLMNNMTAVQIGMVQFLLPMMVLPLVSTMRQIDHTKLLAARILGANPLRTFWHIYLPMCLPGLVAGSVLVFITALGFYVTPALLGSDKNMMVSVLIERQVSQALNWQLASALATVLLAMVLLSISLIAYVAGRRGVRLAIQ